MRFVKRAALLLASLALLLPCAQAARPRIKHGKKFDYRYKVPKYKYKVHKIKARRSHHRH